MSTDEQAPQQDPPSEEDKVHTPAVDANAENDDTTDIKNRESEQIPEDGEGTADEKADGSGDPAAIEEQLQAAKDQTLRVQAEMQNLRRRVDRDIEKAHKYALENFLGELLPVVDNLERGLSTLNEGLDSEDEAQKAIGEGIELTLKSFVDVLVRNKVEPVDPVDLAFDPEFHQAMAMIPHPEVSANTIIEVFQKGYLLNGRLLRPAMVVVSKGPEDKEA